jgi:replication fork protection complex subunit Tof1/Swi1
MADDEIISIPSDDETEALVDRRAILAPAIQSVVDALGGFENGVYRLGDECYSCLKDLKKLWRKDESDDERTVARIFWETRVLPNDLIPILLETAGKGHVEDKRAIACADLMTAMTWPIDLAEELKELDEEIDRGTDYTQLLLSHLQYKAALLQPRIFDALFGIVLPCLAKDAKERKEKDIQITSVVLYLVRNLAFIKDLPSNMNLSSDQAEFSSLQSKLIRTLSETKITEFLLTIASNAASDPLFNRWNTLALEIFYLLFRGIRPSTLVLDQTKARLPVLFRQYVAYTYIAATNGNPTPLTSGRKPAQTRMVPQRHLASLPLWHHHLCHAQPEQKNTRRRGLCIC